MIPTYKQLDTTFDFDTTKSWLTNNYCPICLKRRNTEDLQYHHCIWVTDGGVNNKHNLLRICSTCHATATNGCKIDKERCNLIAVYHQLAYFGLSIINLNGDENKRNYISDFYTLHPKCKEYMSIFNLYTHGKQFLINEPMEDLISLCIKCHKAKHNK